MKVSNVNVYGLEESIRRAKFPMSVDADAPDSSLTNGIKKLAAAEPGSGHDQFLTGIVVQFDLACTIKMWTEFQRYHFADFVSSQSTMHRIARFDIDALCCEYVLEETRESLKRLAAVYNDDPTPENYLYLLYNVPVGLELTAGITTNYRQLKTMYQQRKTHRLPEWREFCRWIETLPMADEFIVIKESAE